MGATWNEETVKRKKSVVRKLKRYTEANQLSTNDLGELLGVSPKTVRDWIVGRSLPVSSSEDEILELVRTKSGGTKSNGSTHASETGVTVELPIIATFQIGNKRFGIIEL